jgi:hypothetical protein
MLIALLLFAAWYVYRNYDVVGFVKRALKRIGKWFMRFLGLSLKEDTVYLTAGSHEIRIDVDGAPVTVWVTFDDQEGVPVCQGSIDKVGIQQGDTFFILYADIYSESRVVRWFAVLN